MSVAYVPRDRVAIVDLGKLLTQVTDPASPQHNTPALRLLREAIVEAVLGEEPEVVLIRDADAYWAAPRDVVLSEDDIAEWMAVVESLLQSPPLERVGPEERPDRPAVVVGDEGVTGVWADLDSTGLPPSDEVGGWAHNGPSSAPRYEREPAPAAAPPPAAEPPAAAPPAVVRGDRRRGFQPREPAAPPGGRRRGGAVPEAAPPPSESEPLTRTPHMDAPTDPQPVGATFTASVWLDEEGQREGELSQRVELHVPPGVKRVDLSVWLSTSDHFSVEGDVVQPLAIERDRTRSEDARFEVVVRKVPDHDEDPLLTAVFSHAGRPCGRVSRAVPIVGAPDYEPPAPPPPGPPSIHVDTRAAVADLTVVVTGDPARARHYECRVESPHLPEGWGEPTGEWHLSDSVPAIIGGYLAEFLQENLSASGRVAALRGAGVKLFDSSPPVFRNAYWELVDRKRPPRSIFVVSEEPHYPWELLVPRRPRRDGPGFERHEPLGVQCAMGRWVRSDSRPAAQQLTLSSAHVIAPEYRNPDLDLPMAEAEAKFVCDNFSGSRLKPAEVTRLDEVLGDDPRPLVHFVGHGKVVEAVGEALTLEGGQDLTLTQLSGLAGVEDGVARAKPLIFVNACEVGRNVPALTKIDGFAAAFTDMGASCVLAPIWSVRDTVAHDIARELYTSIIEHPEVPPAEVLRRLREKGYGPQGEDTYVAYCFFGDPLTRCATA